jgi:hypothetical protein
MFYPDEDEYGGPQYIRQYTKRPYGADDAKPKPAKKQKTGKMTVNVLDKNKGLSSRSIPDSIDFKFNTLKKLLVVYATKYNKNVVDFEIPRAQKASTSEIASALGATEKKKDVHNVHWAKSAIAAIASVLEMRIRKVLSTAAIIMGGSTATLNHVIISKALAILGEPQSMKGMDQHDKLITEGLVEHTPETLTKIVKNKLKESAMAAQHKQWTSDLDAEDGIVATAFRLFVPSVMKALCLSAGVTRHTPNLRFILTNYAVNMVGNIVLKVHPILALNRRSTVTVRDVQAAMDSDGSGAPLLGFNTIVPHRVKHLPKDASAEDTAVETKKEAKTAKKALDQKIKESITNTGAISPEILEQAALAMSAAEAAAKVDDLAAGFVPQNPAATSALGTLLNA